MAMVKHRVVPASTGQGTRGSTCGQSGGASGDGAVALIGVIPAAGYATRLQGSPYAEVGVSKEMLEVRGRPVIAHLVARMRDAGCDDIRVVTRPDKADVITFANDTGLSVVTGRPEHVVASVSLALIRPAGTVDDVVLLGFPDTVWQPDDGFVQLVRELEAGDADVVLGLFGSDEAARGDVVTLAGDQSVGRVTAIEVEADAAVLALDLGMRRGPTGCTGRMGWRVGARSMVRPVSAGWSSAGGVPLRCIRGYRNARGACSRTGRMIPCRGYLLHTRHGGSPPSQSFCSRSRSRTVSMHCQKS